MRSRYVLFALVAVVFVMPTAAQAGIPFFGPIIPPQSVTGVQGSEVCAASWGMLVQVINNIISFLITIVIVFVAPLMIAWAGFLMVLNPTKAGDLEKGKTILWHMVIGVIIALAGWLIVDAVMAVLYKPSPDSKWTTTWSQLITSGGVPICIPLKASLNQATQQNTTGVSTGGLNVPRGDLSGSACDPAAVKAAAARSGLELSDREANTFACIAKPESTCGKAVLNYSWNKLNAKGKASTAVGPFQVLLSSNHACYENNACRQAANVTGPLNCQRGFGSNGLTTGGDSTVLDYCVKAAANLDCSTAAAVCLMRQSGSFKDWQADVNNAVQTGCIKSN